MPYLTRATPEPEPIDCRILSAGLDLIVEHGYHNVSVHDIQKRANVSIGSIYNHFGGKEGIAKALYHHLTEELMGFLDNLALDEQSACAQCETIIRGLFGLTETHPTIIAFIFHQKHREFLADERSIYSTPPFRRMRAIVEQGMAAGEIPQGDLWVASSMIYGGAILLIQQRLDGLLHAPLQAYEEALLATLWRH